jgi:YD repeat-containing protein
MRKGFVRRNAATVDSGHGRSRRHRPPSARSRIVLAILVAIAAFAAIAQPVLSNKDDEIIERVEAAKPGPQPKIVDEIPEERTATSKTFATEDGGRTVKVFPEPVHFRNHNGNLQEIDSELVDSPLDGFALRNGANRFRADLPADASKPVRFAVGHSSVRFGLRGAAGAGRKHNDSVRYASALSGVDLVYDMRPMGVKETLVLRDRKAPSEFVFDVSLSRGLELRDGQDGAIAIVGDDDETVARFDAPFAFDATPGHGEDAIDADRHATLRVEDDDTLRLSVDRDWLEDEDRAFPVSVDPTVTYVDGSAKIAGAVADTYLSSDNPTTSYGTSGVMAAGHGLNGNTFAHDHRALLRFDVAGAVPPDSVVFSATLGMYAERQENANAGALRVREVSRSWTESASWSRYDGTNAWTTAGGDMASFASLGVQPAIGWTYWKDLQPLAERWVQGASTNNGLLVERCCGAPDNVYEFTSSNGTQAQWPYLQIWYTQRAGSLRQYSFWHPDGTVTDGADPDRPGLNSMPDVNVNVATGNLFLRAQDRAEEAPGGVELTRSYNSVWWGHNNLGRGWALDNADVTLTDYPDGNVRLDGPGDTTILFRRKPDNTYEKGQGVDATLARATDGTTDWWVTFTETGERYVFGGINVRVAKKVIDGEGRVTTLSNHADGKSFIVTDGLGKATNIIRDAIPEFGAGWYRVSRVEAPGQTFSYTYDVNYNLSTVTAPGSKVTRYSYQPEVGPNGEVYDKRLTKITNPDGSEVKFTYAGPWGSRQIASYTTRAPGATVDGPTTRFAYHADRTVITDPSGKQTTYFWEAPARRVTRVDTGAAPPAVALSGTLYDRRDQTLAEDGTKYTLTASATSAASVKSVEILVDGEREDFAEQTCTAGCGLTRTWTLDSADFPSGSVTVTAMATTAAGDTQTRQFRVTVGGDTTGTGWTSQDPIGESDDGAETSDPTPAFEGASLAENQTLLENDKTAAEARYQARQGGGTTVPPTVTTRTDIFNNLNADGDVNTGLPPDPTGAIGRDRYIEMTNFRITMYNRTTLQRFTGTDSTRTLRSFARPREFVYDPQIVWDESSNRFFYAAASFEYTTNASGQRVVDRTRNHVVYGWSRTSAPTDLSRANWCKYRTPRASVDQDDYPKLGVSRRFIIIGSNVFRNGVSRHSRLRVANKPGRVAAGQTSSCPAAPDTNREAFRDFNNLAVRDNAGGGTHRAFTPVPVVTGVSTSASGWVVSADSGGAGTAGARGNKLVVWRVVGSPRRGPRLRGGRVGRSIVTDEYFVPTSVPQDAALAAAGTPAPRGIDTSDTRITQAVGDDDPGDPATTADDAFTIWTQHTVEAPARDGRSVVRWYQLNPRTLTRVQQGAVDSTQVDGAQADTFVFGAAISPAGNGRDAVIHYNIGAHDRRVELHARSRRGTDTAGTMVGSQRVVVQSPATLDPNNCNASPRGRRADGTTITVCRWGDYAGATPDPLNASVVWGTGMYIGADRRYRARNFALQPVAGP